MAVRQTLVETDLHRKLSRVLSAQLGIRCLQCLITAAQHRQLHRQGGESVGNGWQKIQPLLLRQATDNAEQRPGTLCRQAQLTTQGLCRRFFML